MIQTRNINEALYGVGKKLRTSFSTGKITEKQLIAVYNRNKKEADAFEGYGWTIFDLIQEEKHTHNPLLRTKLQKLIEEHKEKSRCSNSQNALSIAKLNFYRETALGCGIRFVRDTLYKIGKGGDDEATIIAMLLDIEFANLMAKKRNNLKTVIYERKHILLEQISDLLYDNNWRCGISAQTGKNAGWIVYVYLPDGTQLCWHCNEYTLLYYYDEIDCVWDNKPCSTLEKLLTYAHEKYNIGKPLEMYSVPESA